MPQDGWGAIWNRDSCAGRGQANFVGGWGWGLGCHVLHNDWPLEGACTSRSAIPSCPGIWRATGPTGLLRTWWLATDLSGQPAQDGWPCCSLVSPRDCETAIPTCLPSGWLWQSPQNYTWHCFVNHQGLCHCKLVSWFLEITRAHCAIMYLSTYTFLLLN